MIYAIIAWAVFSTLAGLVFLYKLINKKKCDTSPDLSGIVLSLKFTNNLIIKGKIMAATITDTQFITGTLSTVNKKGQPAPVELGTIEYSSSNEAVFTVTEDPANENGFTVTAVGAGTGQLNYSADADLGEGQVTISGFTDIVVTPAQATGFNVTFGAPQEQEAAPTE